MSPTANLDKKTLSEPQIMFRTATTVVVLSTVQPAGHRKKHQTSAIEFILERRNSPELGNRLVGACREQLEASGVSVSFQ